MGTPTVDPLASKCRTRCVRKRQVRESHCRKILGVRLQDDNEDVDWGHTECSACGRVTERSLDDVKTGAGAENRRAAAASFQKDNVAVP